MKKVRNVLILLLAAMLLTVFTSCDPNVIQKEDPADFTYLTFAKNWKSAQGKADNMPADPNYTKMTAEDVTNFNKEAGDRASAAIEDAVFTVTFKSKDTLSQKSDGTWTFVKYVEPVDYSYKTFIANWNATKGYTDKMPSLPLYPEIGKELDAFNKAADKAASAVVTDGSFIVTFANGDKLTQAANGLWSFESAIDYSLKTLLKAYEEDPVELAGLKKNAAQYLSMNDAQKEAFNNDAEKAGVEVKFTKDSVSVKVGETGIVAHKIIQDAEGNWKKVDEDMPLVGNAIFSRLYFDKNESSKTGTHTHEDRNYKYFAITNTGDKDIDLSTYAICNKVSDTKSYVNPLPKLVVKPGVTVYFSNGWDPTAIEEDLPNFRLLPEVKEAKADTDPATVVDRDSKYTKNRIFYKGEGTLELGSPFDDTKNKESWTRVDIAAVNDENGPLPESAFIRYYDTETKVDRGFKEVSWMPESDRIAQMDAPRPVFSFEVFNNNWIAAGKDVDKISTYPNFAAMNEEEFKAFKVNSEWIEARLTDKEFILQQTEYISIRQNLATGIWSLQDDTPADYSFKTFLTNYNANIADLTKLGAWPIYSNMDAKELKAFTDAASTDATAKNWEITKTETEFRIVLATAETTFDVLSQDKDGVWAHTEEKRPTVGDLVVTNFHFNVENKDEFNSYENRNYKFFSIKNISDATIDLANYSIENGAYYNALPSVKLEKGATLYIMNEYGTSALRKIYPNMIDLPFADKTVPAGEIQKVVTKIYSNKDGAFNIVTGDKDAKEHTVVDKVVIDGKAPVTTKNSYALVRNYNEANRVDSGWTKVDTTNIEALTAAFDSKLPRAVFSFDTFFADFEAHIRDYGKMCSAPTYIRMNDAELKDFNDAAALATPAMTAEIKTEADKDDATKTHTTFVIKIGTHELCQSSSGHWYMRGDYSYSTFKAGYEADKEKLTGLSTYVLYGEASDRFITEFNEDELNQENPWKASKVDGKFVVAITEGNTLTKVFQNPDGTWHKETTQLVTDFSFATFKAKYEEDSLRGSKLPETAFYATMDEAALKAFNEDPLNTAKWTASVNTDKTKFSVVIDKTTTVVQDQNTGKWEVLYTGPNTLQLHMLYLGGNNAKMMVIKNTGDRIVSTEGYSIWEKDEKQVPKVMLEPGALLYLYNTSDVWAKDFPGLTELINDPDKHTDAVAANRNWSIGGTAYTVSFRKGSKVIENLEYKYTDKNGVEQTDTKFKKGAALIKENGVWKKYTTGDTIKFDYPLGK